MASYVALLRGINLGSKNAVSMADLATLFKALDVEDVKTHLRSGNVVFKSSVASAKLREAIEQRIASDLGLRVTVVVRTAAQLEKIVGRNPFGSEKDPKKVHVSFLAGTPRRERVKALDAAEFEPDTFRVLGQEVYLHTPNGYGRSKLGNAWFEKQLGVAGTARNWRTVTTLAELAKG